MIIINQESKKMAELLRNGNTMLNLACPVCNNPIFKNKNQKLFCPVCNRSVIIVNQKSSTDQENSSISDIREEDVIKDSNTSQSLNIKSLIDAINKKINWLVELINEEFQVAQLEKQVKIVKEFIEILEKVKNIFPNN